MTVPRPAPRSRTFRGQGYSARHTGACLPVGQKRGRPDRKRAMVGDPGIEPGAGRPGGVTVRCRTLQLVAHRVKASRPSLSWAIQAVPGGVNRKNPPARPAPARPAPALPAGRATRFRPRALPPSHLGPDTPGVQGRRPRAKSGGRPPRRPGVCRGSAPRATRVCAGCAPRRPGVCRGCATGGPASRLPPPIKGLSRDAPSPPPRLGPNTLRGPGAEPLPLPGGRASAAIPPALRPCKARTSPGTDREAR